jgi:AbrB family looped-hinge helix DNA binding protein
MAKVTSKLQVTVPKAVAERLGIRAGDEIDWRVEGHSARVTRSEASSGRSLAERLAIFDEATARQEARNRAGAGTRKGRTQVRPDRGWTRDELYTRGRAR